MNRIDRISAILIQLQTRRVVKASDIAERFNISLRTVYRDIRALEEAGIPLIGEAGVGYSLAEGYRLPPVMFTPDEAIAFLTAEKLVEKLTDTANGISYKSAMYKIKAVLRSTDKELLEQIDEHIIVLQSKSSPSETPDLNQLQTILKSIAEKQVLDIEYFTNYRQEHTNRQIEPVGVFYLYNYWHLIAFCRMRNDYRDFRLDRIRKLRLTEQRYQRSHPQLKEYLEQEYQNRSLSSVTIRVDKKAVPHLNPQKYYNGLISERADGDCVEMQFMTVSEEGFARWFLMFADHADIISPQSLKNRISDILDAMSSRTRSPAPVILPDSELI